ncbi:UDP-N-acetylglucosamine 1-carboxyvinyltransferase [Arcobacter cloacae]|uniref:UDP-N-acetylglucosamine 1-carboxyvinyltransferase n=1 Tax=Arcobacter cloacae TaxID=1054034 RepID=A0A4Q0ZH27_9BACT|nr:UDP-N-acetylglucosamine 1-carboxyvinyltransferase [Arcobacter cloacae]RXJ82868.1 UDP-N-acetylglucosamine 1-carboxyvinyltransferase [Arcobacter cloacae]
MSKVKVEKSVLRGEVTISGAKNSSLRLLAASILTSENIELTNVPNGILDFQVHIDMLKVLGKEIETFEDRAYIKNDISTSTLEWDRRSIRNTLLILGALLTKSGFGKVPLPGGCQLGDRKYDLHIMAMEKMGAKVWEEDGYICAKVDDRLKGADIHLRIRSTGATENSIIMGTLAKGKTKVWNPHIRPEIIDLIDMLNSMGAKIKVNGQESIEIEGVEKLHGTNHKCIPDNMEALTFAIATAITGGEVEIKNFPLAHLEIPMIYLRESGLKYYVSEDRNSIIVKKSDIYPVEIATGPYPSLNSDMQPLFAIYGLMAQGESRIIDLRFPGRYEYANELAKMGAKTEVEGDMLKLFGGNKLNGDVELKSLDLRAGAAFVLAGLVSETPIIVTDYEQVERGYENFIGKLRKLGVNIEQI